MELEERVAQKVERNITTRSGRQVTMMLVRGVVGGGWMAALVGSGRPALALLRTVSCAQQRRQAVWRFGEGAPRGGCPSVQAAAAGGSLLTLVRPGRSLEIIVAFAGRSFQFAGNLSTRALWSILACQYGTVGHMILEDLIVCARRPARPCPACSLPAHS